MMQLNTPIKGCIEKPEVAHGREQLARYDF